MNMKNFERIVFSLYFKLLANFFWNSIEKYHTITEWAFIEQQWLLS